MALNLVGKPILFVFVTIFFEDLITSNFGLPTKHVESFLIKGNTFKDSSRDFLFQKKVKSVDVTCFLESLFQTCAKLNLPNSPPSPGTKILTESGEILFKYSDKP